MKRLACVGLLAGLSLSGVALPVAAHPHSWIDMVSRLQIDDQQRLTALRLSWLFDEFYSATVFDEAKEKGHSEQQELKLFLQDTLTHLATENYLNRMTLDGKKVHFSPAKEGRVSVTDGQIRIDYTLPLPQPLPLASHTLQFAIYDSTYYVEMLHHTERAIELTGPGASHCQRRLQSPNPSAEQMSFAMSLDKTQQADDGLGTAFAEHVFVTCQRSEK